MTIARRVVWPEKGKVELEEYEVGKPGSDEVTIETRYTLISPGTELAWLMALPQTPNRFPQYPGYNHVGTVVEVGDSVAGFSVGDRVASSGKHASLVNVPQSRLLKIPDGLPWEEAAYYRMAAISLQAVRKAQVELGEAVLVMGQGLIGNMALQLSKLSGAFPVIGADVVEERLRLSEQCGADVTVNPRSQDLKAALMDAIGRETIEVILEATGIPSVVNDCLELAGYRARLVLLASTRGITDNVNFYRHVHSKGVSIIGAHNNIRPKVESTSTYWTEPDDCRVVLRLLAAGRIKVAPLTTDVLGFQQAPLAYELLTQEKASHLGVLLDWAGA